jgi:diguanylate cyclase (GGDEF)-like protein
VTEEWSSRLAEGVIDDLVQRPVAPMHLRMRLQTVVRNHNNARELERLREAVAMNAQMDPLTGIYNRATLLSMLFRETDRVQRMKTSLCVTLFDIDDFGHWNSRLGTLACDQLLCAAVQRATRLLRTYDILGRAGKDEFLAILPGCGTADAMTLAERLSTDVFAEPFHVAGESVRLSACFGIASSEGRSPVVVLRDAEKALAQAKDVGPESIQCSSGSPPVDVPTITFLSGGSNDDLLAW